MTARKNRKATGLECIYCHHEFRDGDEVATVEIVTTTRPPNAKDPEDTDVGMWVEKRLVHFVCLDLRIEFLEAYTRVGTGGPI